jgi:import inner membrane translocase subunit TIM23
VHHLPILKTAKSRDLLKIVFPFSVTKMKWQEFFTIKKRQQRVGLGLGLFTGFVTLQVSGAYFLLYRKFDPKPIMGVDPTIWYFGGILACGAAGYVAGSLGGPSFYRLFYNTKLYDQMNREFTRRISKNRPQELWQVGAGDNVRVLDYYGERVFSLQDYRKWLRIQKNFKRTGKLPHKLFQ